MEIVRQLDKESAIQKMTERGYGMVSENISEKNGNTVNFAKTIDLGVCFHAAVHIGSMSISLEMVELKYFATLSMKRFDFFHKDFEKYEKILYLYSKACVDLSSVIFDLVSKMPNVENKLPASRGEKVEPVAVKLTIKERKTNLWELIRQAGKEKGYEKEMAKEFFDYWVEMNPNGKKMRFEMEKVFDVNRRLNTWLQNDKKWLKQYKGRVEVVADKQEEQLKIVKQIIDKTTAF